MDFRRSSSHDKKKREANIGTETEEDGSEKDYGRIKKKKKLKGQSYEHDRITETIFKKCKENWPHSRRFKKGRIFAK